MSTITLQRWCHGPQGVFGTIEELGLYSVEQPWRDNRPFESCIPPGVYDLVPHRSPRWGDTYALVNEHAGVFQQQTGTPGERYACILHPANAASQLQGCVAVGDQLGVYYGEWAVMGASTSVRRLIAWIRDEGITHLDIRPFQFRWP